jgi:hypothetical protein
MATGSRTLKLSILADVDQLKKSLAQGEKDAQGFGDKMGDVGKKVGAAFALAAAAAAAYAVKIGIDGVKSAIEDEAAQLRLANALKTATGATDAQIKATEDYISKTQLATGITDNDLRNSFQRLSVSTKDVTKSQYLLNLAIDVSKGTGKDLATVTEALAKSYEGTDGKLAKLGIGLSAADLKAMDFTQTTQALSDLYGGSAAANAETFQGRIDRLKQGFDEAKESIGYALLPVLEKMVGYIFEYGVPIFNKFKDAWNVVADAIDKNKEKFADFIDLLKTYVLPVLGTVFSTITNLAAKAVAFVINIFGTIIGAITPTVNFFIDAINKIITAWNFVTRSNVGYISKVGSGGNAAGNYDYSNGSSFTYGGSTGATGSSGGGGSASGGMGGVGGGSSAGGSGGGGGIIAGATSLPDLVSKLQGISNKIADTTFLLATDAISSKTAQKTLDGLQKQFDALSNQADALSRTTNTFTGTPFGQAPTINLTVNGAIDSEGTARVIVDTLNDSYYRGTSGASSLVGVGN